MKDSFEKRPGWIRELQDILFSFINIFWIFVLPFSLIIFIAVKYFQEYFGLALLNENYLIYVSTAIFASASVMIAKIGMQCKRRLQLSTLDASVIRDMDNLDHGERELLKNAINKNERVIIGHYCFPPLISLRARKVIEFCENAHFEPQATTYLIRKTIWEKLKKRPELLTKAGGAS